MCSLKRLNDRTVREMQCEPSKWRTITRICFYEEAVCQVIDTLYNNIVTILFIPAADLYEEKSSFDAQNTTWQQELQE